MRDRCSAPVFGGSQDHLVGGSPTFAAGVEGYIGFKLNGTNYGSMRVVFTNNTGGARHQGLGIRLQRRIGGGRRDQTGRPGYHSLLRLHSRFHFRTGQFRWCHQLGQERHRTNILKPTSTYTGHDERSCRHSSLASGSGSINSTSSISVSAGATFIYNSSTALTVAPTLNGSGTSNRACSAAPARSTPQWS